MLDALTQAAGQLEAVTDAMGRVCACLVHGLTGAYERLPGYVPPRRVVRATRPGERAGETLHKASLSTRRVHAILTDELAAARKAARAGGGQ